MLEIFILSADTKRIVPGVHSGVEIIVVLQPVIVLRDAHREGVGLTEEAVAQGGAQVGAEDAEKDQRRQELDQQEEGQVGQTETELEIEKYYFLLSTEQFSHLNPRG